MSHGRMVRTTNDHLHQTHQGSFATPTQSQAAVENALSKLKPKQFPPPLPPSIYPTLVANVDSHINIPTDNCVSTSCKIDEKQKWGSPNKEHQQNKTHVDGSNYQEHLISSIPIVAQNHPPQAKLTTLSPNSGKYDDYLCHCCNDESLTSVLMDLY